MWLYFGKGGLFVFSYFQAKHRALDVARYVINQARKLGHPISNMQLQKVMYYLQGAYGAKYDRPLFYEDIEAWQWGPVIPEVYYAFRAYAASDIPSQDEVGLALEGNELYFINGIIDKLCKYPANRLVSETHSEMPWKLTTNDGKNVGKGVVIRYNNLFPYFESGNTLVGPICE